MPRNIDVLVVGAEAGDVAVLLEKNEGDGLEVGSATDPCRKAIGCVLGAACCVCVLDCVYSRGISSGAGIGSPRAAAIS